MRARFIYEKFTTDSDPIHDMGIGYETYIKNKLGLEYGKELSEVFNGKYCLHVTDEIVNHTKYYDNYEDNSFFGFKHYNGKQYIIAAWNEYEYKIEKYYVLFPIDQFKEELKESMNEKFTTDSDPIKDMGIGIGLVYDIRENPNEEGSYLFKTNNEKIKNLIRKYIHGISDNELNRFWAFTLNDIYDEIPITYFENKNYKKIDKYIEESIQSWEPSWVIMHSDKAMKSIMRR